MQRDLRQPPRLPINAAQAFAPNGPSHSFSAAISMGVTWLFWYLARPAVSWISRNLWYWFCNHWYVGHYEGFLGTIAGNFRWFTNCMPWGEDISYSSYNWRDTIITGFIGGCTYLFSHWYQKIKCRAHNLARAGAQHIENNIDRSLNRLQRHLDGEAAQDENQENDLLAVNVRFLPRRAASVGDIREARSSSIGRPRGRPTKK